MLTIPEPKICQYLLALGMIWLCELEFAATKSVLVIVTDTQAKFQKFST
jgi:hypothetical protein